MAIIATDVVRVLPDFGAFRRGFRPGLARETAGANVKIGVAVDHTRLKQAAKAVTTAIAAAAVGAGVAAGKLFASSIAEASDLAETTSKINVLFGSNAKAVQAFAAKAAIAMGQSKAAVLDGASTFAIYGKQAGKSGKNLVGFSTDLTKMASDMASFSNTSPEEAIKAIGSAMRGENDPIEKYGVLLNDARLKQIALDKGIINTTKKALTPQQRVLAVQAALYDQLGEKGSKTLGDFERTSSGLANQQRILSAQWDNWKATLGTALLPIVTKFVTLLNDKVMPALQKLWEKHGPAVTAFLTQMGEKVGAFLTALAEGDFNGKLASMANGFKQMVGVGRDILHPIFDLLKEVDWQGVGSGLKTMGEKLGSVLAWGKEHPKVVATIVGLLLAYKGLKGSSGGVLTFALGAKPGDGLYRAIRGWLQNRATVAFRASVLTKLDAILVAIRARPATPAATPVATGAAATALRIVGAVAITAATIYATNWSIGKITGDKNPMKTGWDTLKDDGPFAFQDWQKKNSDKVNEWLKHFFAITLPEWMTAGGTNGWSSFKEAFYNTFGNEVAHWFSITLPNSLNPGSGGSGGWAGLVTNIGHFFSTNLPNALNLGEGGGGWAGLGQNLKRWFSTTLPDAMSGRSGGWSGFGQYVKDTLKEQLGWNAVTGTWQGIKEKSLELWQKLTEWKDALVGKVKSLFGIQSPSTVFASIGGQLIDGLWDGFKTKWGELTKTVTAWINDHIIGKFKSVFASGAEGIKTAFAAPFDTLTSKLSGPVGRALSWINTNIIDKVNAVLGKLPGAGKIDHINTSFGPNQGLGDKPVNKALGGRVRGFSRHPRADNIPAMLTANEYVQPVDVVRHYGVGFMDRLRRKEVPRYADGGLVGSLLGSQGDNVITRLLGGAVRMMGGNTIGAIAKKLMGLIGGLLGGGKAGMGWQWMQSVITKAFPTAHITSTTGGGHAKGSWHYKGRAIDIVGPMMQIRNWIMEKFGSNSKELIYSPGRTGIKNGRLVDILSYFGKAVFNDHFDHVHWALSRGGLVPRKYDRGGVLPPGVTLAVNNTGRNEYVSTADQTMRLDPRDLMALARLISKAMAARPITMDGRTVGELIHAYDYAGGL